MNKIDKAIEDFEDENSTLSLSQRFSNLRKAYMCNVLEVMKTIQKHGSKSPVSEEEQYKQTEGMKQFAILEKMYFAELKASKAEGKSAEDLDKSWFQQIHVMKNSVGPIVRNMAEKTGTHE